MAERAPFGKDILEGLRQSAGVSGDVQGDLKQIAEDGRIKFLEGDDRREFFSGMTQPEFDMLHDIAMSLGDQGLNALERMMREGFDQFKETN